MSAIDTWHPSTAELLRWPAYREQRDAEQADPSIWPQMVTFSRHAQAPYSAHCPYGDWRVHNRGTDLTAAWALIEHLRDAHAEDEEE